VVAAANVNEALKFITFKSSSLNVVEAYNPKTNAWSTGLTPMPTPDDSIYAVVERGITTSLAAINSGRQSVVYTYDQAKLYKLLPSTAATPKATGKSNSN
jgi:hypothetical protein